MVRVAWPHIEQVSKDIIKEHIEPKVKAALPEHLGGAFSIDTESLNLGDVEKNIVVFQDEWATIDLQPAEKENIHNARYYVNALWTGDCLVRIHVLGATLGVAHVKVRGSILIVLAALSVKAIAGEGLRISFLQPPDIQFDLTGIGKALELAPMFKRSLQEVVKDKVSENCVVPNWLAFAWPMESRLIFPILFPKPAGFLRLTVQGAHGLRGSDNMLETKVFGCLRHARSVACRGRLSQTSTGASDPYFVLECGAQRRTSEIRWKTLSPVYNETFVLAVSDEHHQYLRLEFWDKDVIGQDDFLGKATISVSSVINWRTGERRRVLLEDEVGHAGGSGSATLSAEWLPLRGAADTRCASPASSSSIVHTRSSRVMSTFSYSAQPTTAHAEPMYLVDLGVYDAVHVTYVGARAAYWLVAECEGALLTHWAPAQETKKVFLESTATDEEANEIARRLKLMREHGMSLEDAASILDLDVEVVANLERELNALEGHCDETWAPRSFTKFWDRPSRQALVSTSVSHAFATTVTSDNKLTFNHMFRFLVPGPGNLAGNPDAIVEIALMRQGEGLLDSKVVVGRAEVAILELLSEGGAASTLHLRPSNTSLTVHLSATAVGGP